MSGKFINAGIGVTAGLAVLFSGAVFFIPAAPAAVPQFERREEDPAQKEMRDHMLKEANKKRQADIKNDTEKLFALATELKTAVDKTNENMLSLDVVRKADEVEKLAKKVKEKMKEAIGPPQNEEQPLRPPRPFPR
ncbi:MAG: hypothetical protein WA738_21945 [Candidatus Angelobacter sp.]